MAVVTIFVAVVYGLPLRDPDGVFGPTYVRFPILLTIVFLADVMPRVVYAPVRRSADAARRRSMSSRSAGRSTMCASRCSGSAAGTSATWRSGT